MQNLTVKGKVDGFGCQLNAKLSGIAFCFNSSKYNYVHTPFTHVAHGWENKAEELNKFMELPTIEKVRIYIYLVRIVVEFFGVQMHITLMKFFRI